MFCPGCSAYLSEKDIIKTMVKYAPGNVAVEYDAQCPNCSVDMGKVSWGQLTPNPELLIKKQKPTEPLTRKQMAEASRSEAEASRSESESSRTKTCPHCGKPLPEDF